MKRISNEAAASASRSFGPNFGTQVQNANPILRSRGSGFISPLGSTAVEPKIFGYPSRERPSALPSRTVMQEIPQESQHAIENPPFLASGKTKGEQPQFPSFTCGSIVSQFFTVYRRPSFLITWLLPFVAFTTNTLVFSYGFVTWPISCTVCASTLVASSLALLSLGSRKRLWISLGVTLLTAAIASTCVGLYIHDEFACFPSFYANSRLYAGMVPSQPSSAVFDAGRITFTSETFVDTNHSTAFVSETGFVYCIAPVREKIAAREVEFWAVGVQCCSAESGNFHCDQAQDPEAHAGIRIFDNNGFFAESRKDFYEQSRKKAEATFGLVSAANPMYVRWVREDNLDMLSLFYKERAVVNLVFFIFLDFLSSAALALAFYQQNSTKSDPSVA